jgi:uncharacterized Zn finger protein (UPF0148 family)
MEDQVQRFPLRSSIICPICRKEQVSEEQDEEEEELKL